MMTFKEAKERLIGKTVSFINGEECSPIILGDVAEVIGLESLKKDPKHKELAHSEEERGLIYAVVGKLVQPHIEVDSDEEKNTKTVYVYSDTEIDIIPNEESLSERIEETRRAFNMTQDGY